ncbi:hypothetical protein Taro_042275 [Colocasia esculenta]|uniref:THIF-type NAD/FAD binding fold domain-containing protein n=1 Tax=Colocasia esculenta TaxID=4460 RepID=A0A843WZ79_COLES|nr:hypothetical protein [Colocasia esculenta]
MGFTSLEGSVLLYMLPRKRAGGEEVADVVAGDSVVKKHRTDCLISSSSAGEDNNHHRPPSSMDCESNGSNPPEIDEDLHSRQLAVYGRETMRRLFASNVLISGINGLGAEIAKNLVLAGVKSVTLHDDEAVDLWDLSSNFFLSEEDVGKNRALACVQKLQELNNAVLISTLTTKLSREHLSDFQECCMDLDILGII